GRRLGASAMMDAMLQYLANLNPRERRIAIVGGIAALLLLILAILLPLLRESLVVVVDRTARQSGLDHALVGSQPSGDGGLNVRLEQTPFDGLVAWLAQLRESYGVRVDSAVVDAGTSAGTVNASLVLHAR